MTKTYDVVIAGGSLGGCAAAIALGKMGFKVALTEETDWIGGQLTSQAVPPDEHQWIEEFGCTKTYRELRDRIRDYYKYNYPIKEEGRTELYLNPGQAWVSRLSHEPRVALKVLEDMLSPYVNSGKLTIYYKTRPIRAKHDTHHVFSVTFSKEDNEELTLNARTFVDATECGDLLPLTGTEFVMGAESRDQTQEPHSAEVADPLDMQPITHVVALEYLEGQDFTIPKPEQYDFWKSYVPRYSEQPMLSMTSETKEFAIFPDNRGLMPLWTYRRIIDPTLFKEGLYEGDLSLINWPQNDYTLGPVIGVEEEERLKHLNAARELSLSLVYWLQTEAPRPDGKKGYPGFHLRPDVLGTEDGLAKMPYIREARRIKAMYTITEHDVSKEIRGSKGIKKYKDSIGVGNYHLDVHHTTSSNRSFYIPTYPYEIPLGAIIPVQTENVLPACKNIGTTQVTNGCYRLHPTEWNIGESVGYLAGFALKEGLTHQEIWEDPINLATYQSLLEEEGVQLHWPDTVTL